MLELRVLTVLPRPRRAPCRPGGGFDVAGGAELAGLPAFHVGVAWALFLRAGGFDVGFFGLFALGLAVGQLGHGARLGAGPCFRLAHGGGPFLSSAALPVLMLDPGSRDTPSVCTVRDDVFIFQLSR